MWPFQLGFFHFSIEISFLSFPDLIAHFFLAPDNLPLSGHNLPLSGQTDVCLCIHSPAGGTPWLLPSSGSYEYSCCKHPCVGFCMGRNFQLLWVSPNMSDCCIIGKNMFGFVRNCQAFFQSSCTIFHSHQ